MPVFHYHGPDAFGRSEAYDRLRAANDADGGLAANTTTLNGVALSPSELEAAAMAVPFLAARRLVRVDGFCAPFNAPRGGARRRRATPEAWPDLPGLLAALPPTTLLVFLDGKLDRRNDMRDRLAAAGAEAKAFPARKGKELAEWLHTRARAAGLRLTPAAARRLIAEVGDDDMGALASEIGKLRLYAGDAPVDAAIVAALSPRNLQAQVWDLTDAVAAARPAAALRALAALRAGSDDTRRLLTLIAREFRRIIIAQDMIRAGAGLDAICAHFNFRHPYPGRKLTEHARRWDPTDAADALRRVRDTDAAVQRYRRGVPGGLPDALALEVLVVELSGGVSAARV